jgi:outer membrane protein
MKRLLLILLFVNFFFGLNAFAAKFGRVDVQKVLVTVNQGKKVKSKLQKKFEEKQKILKKEEEAIRKLQETYKKQSLVMNDKAKVKKEREIQEKVFRLREKSMGFQNELQKEEQNLKRPILKNIRTVIDSVSKGGSFDLVFEMGTAPVYIKDYKDITADVIKQYDAKFK